MTTTFTDLITVEPHGAHIQLGDHRYGLIDLYPPASTGRDRWSGWGSHSWNFTIPMENGAIVAITESLSLHLQAPYWAPDPWGPNDHGEIICYAAPDSTIRLAPPLDLSNWLSRHIWIDCEPDWAGEHIQRLSRMPFPDLPLIRSIYEPMRHRPVTPPPA